MFFKGTMYRTRLQHANALHDLLLKPVMRTIQFEHPRYCTILLRLKKTLYVDHASCIMHHASCIMHHASPVQSIVSIVVVSTILEEDRHVFLKTRIYSVSHGIIRTVHVRFRSRKKYLTSTPRDRVMVLRTYFSGSSIRKVSRDTNIPKSTILGCQACGVTWRRNILANGVHLMRSYQSHPLFGM